MATPVLSATKKIQVALDAERTARAQSAGRAARGYFAAGIWSELVWSELVSSELFPEKKLCGPCSCIVRRRKLYP